MAVPWQRKGNGQFWECFFFLPKNHFLVCVDFQTHLSINILVINSCSQRKNIIETQVKTIGGDSSECSLHIPKIKSSELPISAVMSWNKKPISQIMQKSINKSQCRPNPSCTHGFYWNKGIARGPIKTYQRCKKKKKGQQPSLTI